MPHVFISYPNDQTEIAENLRGRLAEWNIEAWVYSRDRTIGDDVWQEIKTRLEASRVVLFIVSDETLASEGQRRELQLTLEKVRQAGSELKMIPVAVGKAKFANLPEELRHINGLELSAYNVKTVALEIAKRFFPETLPASARPEWNCPRPGQWLKVCNLDPIVEEFFKIGDEVYFRRLSPLGLFECYSPQIDGLFWFSPNNLHAASFIDEDGNITRERVPEQYRLSMMLDIEWRGLRELEREGRIPSPRNAPAKRARHS